MPEHEPPLKPARRRFLDWLIGLGASGWAASVVYPMVRYLSPLSTSSSGGPVRLSPEEAAMLERTRFTIVRSGDARILVFMAAGALHALDAKCTHEGCTVQFVPGEKVVWCACHNARFDVEGRVLSGPPPRPLGKWVASRDESGEVVVHRVPA